MRLKQVMQDHKQKTGQKKTQQEYAELIFFDKNPNTAKTIFSDLCTGRKKHIELKYIPRILDVFECTDNELFKL